MPENNDEIKTPVTSVCFVCGHSIRVAAATSRQVMTWTDDPADDKSIYDHLADCELRGWPIFIRNRVAYVYRSDDLPAEYSI
jgi:hypothetical protein